ncbi:SDR family oxidoreductase [Nostoc sp.]|uniref:SDR family oxidoreductase n=1 Tax=Nostoc sp. TaxID=1180 RepID=UPI002FF46F74
MWTRQTQLQASVSSQYFDADPKVVEQQMINSVPMRRLGTLTEVANGVAFLISDQASYITGLNLEITGGQQRRLLIIVPVMLAFTMSTEPSLRATKLID